MKRFTNFLWGMVFIIIGVIIGLNALGITDINIFFRGWWTLFIIVPCFIGIFKDGSKWGDIIGLVIGIALLLCCHNLLKFEWIIKLIIPFTLVMIGLSFIFRDAWNQKVEKKIKHISTGNKQDYTATFGENKVNLQNEVFEGADINAIFGGVELNLVQAIVKEDRIINASAIFGGIDIIVPKEVNVKVKTTPIFGGITNRVTTTVENAPTIYINAFCMFGGVEIK